MTREKLERLRVLEAQIQERIRVAEAELDPIPDTIEWPGRGVLSLVGEAKPRGRTAYSFVPPSQRYVAELVRTVPFRVSWTASLTHSADYMISGASFQVEGSGPTAELAIAAAETSLARRLEQARARLEGFELLGKP